MNEIIYSERVRQYVGTHEEVQTKRIELEKLGGCFLRLWHAAEGDTWTLEVWTAKPEEYTRAG